MLLSSLDAPPGVLPLALPPVPAALLLLLLLVPADAEAASCDAGLGGACATGLLPGGGRPPLPAALPLLLLDPLDDASLRGEDKFLTRYWFA